MAVSNEYVPGVCNIGKAEINRRLRLGWTGAAVTVIVGVLLFAFRVDPAWRLFLFLPAAGAASGLLQGYMHFCARFGFSGVLNFGPEVGKTDTVEQAEFRKKDRQKALTIIALSALIGVVVAVVTLLVG